MKQLFPVKCARIQAGVLAVMSMVLIWLPTLDLFFHLDKTSMPNENRALAKFPELQSGAEGLRNYVSGLESFFNDHFGYRKRLIRWQHLWKRDFFKDKSGRDDVIHGRDGWLFYAGDYMVESVRGTSHFDAGLLAAWQKLLESRRDWCAQHGCDYIFVIPPDKQSVYPEQLPEWLVPVKNSGRLDQFLAYMKTNSTVPILDLRPALLAAKTNGILYLQTDSHWNCLGAFAGYRSLIEALSAKLPGLKPLPMEDFDWKLVPQSGGDLARLLGQEDSMSENEDIIFSPRQPPLKPMAATVDTNLLVKKWPIHTEPVFTSNPEGRGKVVLFHDSFANDWQSLLGYHFNKVIYIWQYNWDMDFLERQKPDVVIDEMLERFVISKDPANLTENY